MSDEPMDSLDQESEEIRRVGKPGGTEIAVGTGTGEDDQPSFEWAGALPVLPLKNTVLFPHILSPLLVNTQRSQALIDEVLVRPDRMMVAAAVLDPSLEGSPGPDEIYRVGTVLRVVKMLKFPDQSYRLLVQGVGRVAIGEFEATDPFLRAHVTAIEEQGDYDSVEMTALVRNVTGQFASLVSESTQLSDELQFVAANVGDPSQLADMVAHHLDFDVGGKQKVLEEAEVTERLKRVLSQINKENEALQLETEIKEKVQTEMGRTQRDYMLRQQLEAIRRELGESEEGEEGAEGLRERIEEAGLPETALKQATRELERLAQTPSAAAEHTVIRAYLEWIADLPWSKLSKDHLDVRRAREILDEDH